MLQKRYYLDHLTKKSVRNRGQLAQYFATGTHPAIVSTDVFERTRQMIELNRQKNNAVQKPPAHYPLSGVIQCGNCGRFFSRVKRNGHPKWQCATYRRKGMNACPAKEIPEETLYSLLCDTLGLEVFDATILQTQIAKILITGPNTVRFIFHGGREMDAQWQDRSRSESWTEEMRNAARELMKSKG